MNLKSGKSCNTNMPSMEKMRRDVIRQSEQKKQSLRRKFDEISMEVGTKVNQPIQQEIVSKPMSLIFSDLMNRKDPSIVYSGLISIGRFCMTDSAIKEYLDKQILCKLHHWQLEGLEFIANREADRDNIGSRGLMLGDEMGLGKTIMSFQHILLDNQECCRVTGQRFNRPTLIVVKDILLVENWLAEMRSKWPSGTFHYYRLYSSGNEKLDRIYLENCCDFVIVTYSTIKFAYKFRRDNEQQQQVNEEFGDDENNEAEDEQSYKYDILYGIEWKRIIADESHIFAKRSTLLYKAMVELNSDIKWAVSASPIQNAWNTIYSSYHFIGVTIPNMNLTNNIVLPTKEQLATIESIKKVVMIRRLQRQVMQQQRKLEGPNTNDLKLPLFTKVTKRVRIIEFESELEKLIYYQ